MLYLQTDGQVNPRTKSGADSSGRQADVLEQLREGVWEGESRAFLCYHHTASHTRQAHTTGLKHTQIKWFNPSGTLPIFCSWLSLSIYAYVCMHSSPWVAQSESPTLWCRAPWRSRSRKCLWFDTDWVYSATETSSSPTQREESGQFGDLSRHYKTWGEREELDECWGRTTTQITSLLSIRM